MKKRVFLVIIIAFLISSCGKNPNEQIVGSWKGETGNENIKFSVSYTFNNDGTGKVNLMNFQGVIKNYKIDDSQSKLILQMTILDPYGNEKLQKRQIEFVSNNEMKIIENNGSIIILKKQ